MQKYLFLAAAVFLLAGSCSKRSSELSVIDDDGEAPEAILFGTNVITVKSKAGGGIDEWDASQKLYIYGYDREKSNFAVDTAFIDNVEALSPVSGTTGEINVYDPKKPASTPFYYQGKTNYDFYGYYVDDAATMPEPIKETSRIYMPFIIDGGQDLMIAKADQTADIAKAGRADAVAEEDAYSQYSARRQVHPTLKFEHQLSRFVFYIVGGGENYSNIKVESITLTSKTSGNLVIVGESRGIVDASDDSVLYLKEKDAATGKLVPLGTNEAVIPDRTAKRIGESLLVIPGEDKYILKIDRKQDQETAFDVYDITPSIVIPQTASEKVTAFEKGKQYKVTITVYGLEDIRITTELTAWEPKGDIFLDPDDPTTW